MNENSKPAQILLLSGGLDSVVNCAIAVEQGPVVLALTFDYGQHAAAREIAAADSVAAHYAIPHRVIPLPWMKEITASALVAKDLSLPELDEGDLSDASKTKKSARAVWVPNRNGVFIEIAAAFAEALEADRIVTGFNREEAETFPDNTEAYLSAVTASLSYSTLRRVHVLSYTANLEKKDIVRTGMEHNVPFDRIWSCYLGREKMCGRCESCRRFKRAISGTEVGKTMESFFDG
jgi:7-cyano-7-deazaguanine synthase